MWLLYPVIRRGIPIWQNSEAFKLQEIPESYIYPLTSLLSQLRLKWFSFCTGQLFVEVAQSTKKPIRFVICLFLCPAVAEITNSYFVPPPTLWLPLLLLLLLLVPHMILAFSRCPPLPLGAVMAYATYLWQPLHMRGSSPGQGMSVVRRSCRTS